MTFCLDVSESEQVSVFLVMLNSEVSYWDDELEGQ